MVLETVKKSAAVIVATERVATERVVLSARACSSLSHLAGLLGGLAISTGLYVDVGGLVLSVLEDDLVGHLLPVVEVADTLVDDGGTVDEDVVGTVGGSDEAEA